MSSTSSNDETMSYGDLEFPKPQGLGITPSYMTDFSRPSLRPKDSRSSHADSAFSNISTPTARPPLPYVPVPQAHIHHTPFPVTEPLRPRSPPLEHSLPRICKRHGHADRYGHVFEPGLLDVVLAGMFRVDAAAGDEDGSDGVDDEDAPDGFHDGTTEPTSTNEDDLTAPRTPFCRKPTLATLEGRDDADALGGTQGEDGADDNASISAHRAAVLHALEGPSPTYAISSTALRTFEGFPYHVDVATRHPPPTLLQSLRARLTSRRRNKIASPPVAQDPLPERTQHFRPANLLAYIFTAVPIYCPHLGVRISDPGSVGVHESGEAKLARVLADFHGGELVIKASARTRNRVLGLLETKLGEVTEG